MNPDAACTHPGCAPFGHEGACDGCSCPYRGSVCDASGRTRQGPVLLNLAVPECKFPSDGKV